MFSFLKKQGRIISTRPLERRRFDKIMKHLPERNVPGDAEFGLSLCGSRWLLQGLAPELKVMSCIQTTLRAGCSLPQISFPVDAELVSQILLLPTEVFTVSLLPKNFLISFPSEEAITSSPPFPDELLSGCTPRPTFLGLSFTKLKRPISQ